MAKSSTTTGSDALYMTDDLEGRLGPEDLVEPAKKPPPSYIEEEDGPTLEHEEEAVMKPERARASVSLRFFGAAHTVEGVLNSFSFGKGWLCALDDVDEATAIAMSVVHATYKTTKGVELVIEVNGNKFVLTGDLDFTVGYGYNGCTFTVTADDGSYVGE